MRSESRPDPILPAVTVQERPEREAGRLAFGGIVEERKSLPAQLPLLPAPEGPRVPILELSDWRGVPTMAKGRGAPLDLRLAVGACILTPHAARAARGLLAVTVRELRDFLFPNGWQRGRDWPRIRDALFRARDYVLPDGRGYWLPFALRREPGEDAALDDLVLIDIELPPGSAHGPIIDRHELARLGVNSAPRFRAYIGLPRVGGDRPVRRIAKVSPTSAPPRGRGRTHHRRRPGRPRSGSPAWAGADLDDFVTSSNATGRANATRGCRYGARRTRVVAGGVRIR